MSSETVPDSALVREFVIAGHGNLPKVQEMLGQHPELLNAAYQWSEKDFETAVQAAAQVGSASVAEFLISKGAPLEICTAAMLGRMETVEEMIRKDAGSINAKGAHGIPLLPHAALSGNVELCRTLWVKGARGGTNLALHNAVSRGKKDVAQWLLDNASPDLGSKNFEGKTALAQALGRNDQEMAGLLRSRGAVE